MRNRTLTIRHLLQSAGLSLCALLGAAPVWAQTARQPDASPTGQVVGVAGNGLTLNGRRWLPRGVNISGFVATEATFRQDHRQDELNARRYYGPREFTAARGWHVDLLRIQVSQPSLDPDSQLFRKQYVSAVIDAIEQARRAGFVVEIMMQDEPISGEPNHNEMPTKATVRDWDYLTGLFGRDRGIVFELFNEPALPANSTDWSIWKDGGVYAAGAAPAVGMQALISRLRAEGSLNVMVLDGLDLAHTLAGLPTIEDPLNRIAYAVHPYPDGSANQTDWGSAFGNASTWLPVFADEWSAKANTKIGLGDLPSFQVAVNFLNYIRFRNIPLAGGAFDLPGFLVKDVPGWTPSNYDNYATCYQDGFKPAWCNLDDAGKLVQTLFLTNYRVALTDADAITH